MGSGDRSGPSAFTHGVLRPIRTQGMDQTFTFRAAPVPLRRRLHPRTIALAVAACLVLSGIASFARWVSDSERRSLERARAAEDGGAVVGTISGPEVTGTAEAIEVRLAIDVAARADARSALGAAQRAARGRATFLDAGPGQLAGLVPAVIFVDGPSAAPGVVSVRSSRDAWGAAVMGASGTCYLLRFAPGDGVTYGTGPSSACTGRDALLGARGSSW